MVFFENCVAAALAPAMAALRVGDESSSVLDLIEPLLSPLTSDPGVKENGFRGSGKGNLIGNGASTGERPLRAPSRTYTTKKADNKSGRKEKRQLDTKEMLDFVKKCE